MKSWRKVWVLGGERSGSTWLANILDADPEHALIMEPFFAAYFFEGFPSRNVYAGSGEAGLIGALRLGFLDVARARYALTYRPGRPNVLRALDRWLLKTHGRIASTFAFSPALSLLRHRALNLHESEIPVQRLTPKATRPALEVIKELRLNFKVRLLEEAFPGSKYLVSIRHPGAQLASILSLFSKGRLKELAFELQSLGSQIRCHSRFAHYAAALETHAWSSGPPGMLAVWWLVNYDVLLADLAAVHGSFHVVEHERLSQQPLQEVRRIYEFLERPLPGSVEEYVEWSSSVEVQKPTPVTTTRNSREFQQAAVARVDPRLRELIDEVADRVGPQSRALSEYLTRVLRSSPSVTADQRGSFV